MRLKKEWLALSAVLLFIASSCIPSLYPLYTKDNLVIDDTIVGTWTSTDSPDEPSIWKIKKYKNIGADKQDPLKRNLYILEHTQQGEEITFYLYLCKLGDSHYFNFYPKEYGSKNEMKNMHLFPVHTFAKVDIQSKTISIAYFDIDFLNRLIEQNKIRISHERSEDNIILTASTKELQKFVLKYAKDERAFIDPTILKRKA